MKFCIVRAVRDDFESLHMATAMCASGGEPFAVVVNPRADLSMRWHVFARFEATSPVETIAKEIDDLFDSMMGRG